MRTLSAIAIAAAALTACSTKPDASRAPGASIYETRSEAIEAVERVSVSGPFQVYITGKAAEPEVSAVGPREMLADTIIEVVDETLVIRFKKGARWSWNPGAGVNVAVKLPAVSSIAVEGPSRVKASLVGADTFEAGIGGSGQLSIAGLTAKAVQLGVGGSGSISVEGVATDAQIGIGGSGAIDAKRLRVENAQIGIGGSGSVYADVSKSADIGIGGSGRVEVVGGAECKFDEGQASQIDCR